MEDLVQLVFSIPNNGAAEAVCSLLTEEGGGVEQRDAETTPSLESGITKLLVWLPSTEVSRRVQAVEQLLLSLKDMGTTVEPWSWNTEVVDPQSWQEAYKQFFSVTHLGKRIVVKPSWEDYTPASREKIIELDPGMAFGTGLHASTQLVIHMMERLARSCPSPLSVLDMGCGTGILSIAAAQLWPNARIYAIDNDELAVQVCKENVQRNKLDGHIKVQLQSGAEVDATYDLVLANLTFETLTDLHPKMRNYASDFGRLILSGLLVEQAISLGRLYCRELIWEPEYTEAIGDWMAFLLRMR